MRIWSSRCTYPIHRYKMQKIEGAQKNVSGKQLRRPQGICIWNKFINFCAVTLYLHQCNAEEAGNCEKKNNKKSTLSQINIECSFGPKQKAIAQNAEWPKNHPSPTPYKFQHQLLSPAFCCHLRRIWGKR